MESTRETYFEAMRQVYRTAPRPMSEGNHKEHDSNPEYWDVLLGPIKKDPDRWSGKTALDYGCGAGRNLTNLLFLADWAHVYGCDVSPENMSKILIPKATVKVCDGQSIPLPDQSVDFVMSTITLQHISNYEIRKSILTDMFRVLVPDGVVSVQVMNYSAGAVGWFSEDLNAKKNSSCENPQYLQDDLESIGFKDVQTTIGEAWGGPNGHWIYASGTK